MNIDVFTLFPAWFEWFREQRHVARALEIGHSFECIDPRASTPLKWGQVDDTPFGGGAGMVLRVDVMEAALRARYGVDPVALRASRRVIALVPGGRLLDDALVSELAAEPSLTLLCGRYEGFDERILEHFCSDQISIGRYVLAGGELPAMVLSDAVSCASSRACSARTSRRSRSRSLRRWREGSSTRTTRARPSGAGGRCRTCSSPAITSGSASGGSKRAAAVRYHDSPACAAL